MKPPWRMRLKVEAKKAMVNLLIAFKSGGKQEGPSSSLDFFPLGVLFLTPL